MLPAASDFCGETRLVEVEISGRMLGWLQNVTFRVSAVKAPIEIYVKSGSLKVITFWRKSMSATLDTINRNFPLKFSMAQYSILL
jgi:hypothetical protein